MGSLNGAFPLASGYTLLPHIIVVPQGEIKSGCMLEHPVNPALPLSMSKGENVSGADNQQETLLRDPQRLYARPAKKR